MPNLIENYLENVMKPGRYIGQEWNVSKKDFNQAELKFGLCFPDTYEVGMSNLGVRIIYGFLNSLPEVVCERFFSPEVDFENNLRQKKQELFSIESNKVAKEFDLFGFSLGNELCYTNVLNILDLAGFPLEASHRDNAFPLIIGGGPCTLNPEPVHKFFDLFIIGEAEEALKELVEAYLKVKIDYKNGNISKKDLLLKLSDIEGVYVPSFYDLDYDGQGKISSFKPNIPGVPGKIKKRVVKDFENSYFPVDWMVPFIQIVHDRITLEIMRGCPNKCRFCQAKHQYYPLRIRSAHKAFQLAEQAYKNSGYEEIALGGLSVSDYPQIEELLVSLMESFKDKCVSLSLPSIKPKNKVGSLSTLIASVKKTGLTFAPEAATERLQKVLGKDFDTVGFFQALEQSFLAGYQHVKLYFMIGLPFEENADLDGIFDFAYKVSELRRKTSNRAAEVHISINTLIPKPHTAFQWFKMQDPDETKTKQEYLKDRIYKNKKMKLSFHDRYMGFMEGVFSRGDRRLSDVIFLAYKKGARFDAWEERFDFNIWSEAFKDAGIDPNFYLQEKSRDELLPWDFLDIGVSKEFLLSEYDKIIAIK